MLRGWNLTGRSGEPHPGPCNESRLGLPESEIVNIGSYASGTGYHRKLLADLTPARFGTMSLKTWAAGIRDRKHPGRKKLAGDSRHRVGGRGGGGDTGRVYSVYALPQSCDHRPSHSCNAGTEHVGFSPTSQTSRVQSPRRREVFGKSHEG